MSPATVGEVMTRDVIAVEAHTPFQEVVDLLAADHVSAVPVLEDGRVAAEVMTGPAVTVGPQSSLLAAARLMSARRIKRLPVVDENGRLVGILSRRDLLRTAARRDAEVGGELLAGRGSGDDPEILDRGGLRVLGMDECLDRAGSVPVGRIAFEADRYEVTRRWGRSVVVRGIAEEISGREIHRLRRRHRKA
jgi:hypothetical protein